MVSTVIARNIVSIIGNAISFSLFLSPLPTFYKIIKNKSVEEFKSDPYIAAVLNCVWIFLIMSFVHYDSLLGVIINSLGLVIELVYLIIFVIFADDEKSMRVTLCLLFEVLFVTVFVLISLLTLNGTKERSLMIGIISDVFNIMMYISPLTIMKKVITTKSVKYMPFLLSLTNFLNGCVWTTYALMKFDLYMLISHGVGVISGLLQLILYAYYSVMGTQENQSTNNIQLSTVASNV